MARINWTRYCVPRGEIVLCDENGFPNDPEILGQYQQPSAIGLTTVLESPCIVLLGEPGSGKSDTLRQWFSRVEAPESDKLYVDLAEDINPDEELFKTPQFRGWEQGGSLHLFIDSLDEGPRILRPLFGKIRAVQDRSRLRFRIACRTGEIPAYLDDEVPSLWDKDRFFELLPLCRRDIALSAGSDAEPFLQRVVLRGVASLATRPVSLNFLLDHYKKHKDLPDTRWQIFEDGCRTLCTENNTARRMPGLQGKTHSRQRLDTASRIAAVCLLGRKPLIQREIDHHGPGSREAITWAELLAHGDRGAEDQERYSLLEETLHRTALFSSSKDRHLRFAHASYTSFLTARFLKQRSIRLPDLVEECVGLDSTGPIPTEFRDLAGWLAAEDEDTRRWLLRHDPRSLLGSDLRGTSNDVLSRLTAALLEHARDKTLPVYDLRAHYRNLNHEGLAEQLRPWVSDEGRDWLARHMAIEIAAACDCKSLLEPLIHVALSEEDGRVRSEAFATVCKLGAPENWRRLLPILTDPEASPPDYYARRRLIRLLWPQHLAHGEKFAILDAIHNRKGRSSDDLNDFIKDTVVAGSNDTFVVEIFDWIRTRPQVQRTRYLISSLSEYLVRRALRDISRPPILSALARHTATCLIARENPYWHRHEQGRGSLIASMSQKDRRRLVGATVENSGAPSVAIWFRLWSLVIAEDLVWVVEQCLAAADAPSSALWLEILSELVSHAPPLPGSDEENALSTAADRSKELRAALWRWFGPIEIRGERADQMEQEYWRFMRDEATRRENERMERIRENARKTRLSKFVSSIEAATPDPDTIGELLHEFKYYESDGRSYPEDLLATKAWQELPAAARGRMINLAASFLKEQPLPADRSYLWTWHHLLLRFMHEVNPLWAAVQESPLWVEWTPAILYKGEADDAIDVILLRAAHNHAAKYAEWCFTVHLMHAASASHFVRILKFIESVLGPHTTSFVAHLLDNDSYPAEPYGALLTHLFNQGYPGIPQRLRSIVSADQNNARAVIAARILFETSDDLCWSVLESRFSADPGFGDAVVQAIADLHWHQTKHLLDDRDEDALVSAYSWIADRFPSKDDPELTVRMGDDFRYKIGRLRSALLHSISSKSTASALEAIHQLKERRPRDEELEFAVGFARQYLADATWKTLSSQEVFHLEQKPRRAVIVTALPVERRAVLEHLREVAEVTPSRGAIYRRGIFDCPPSRWNVVVAEFGAGNENAAAETERVLGLYSPEVSIFVGVAGALKDLTQGDVVAADKINRYESGKDRDDYFELRPDARQSSYELVARARYEAGEPEWLGRIHGGRTLHDDKQPTATVAPIVSGPKVLASRRTATFTFIRHNYGDAVAVEMEGYGFLQSVQMNHPTQGIVIRGISDRIDDKTPEQDHEWQLIAARHAAAFAFQLLAKFKAPA